MYSQRGNANVRKDLHRLIFPRVLASTDIQHIMWTSTRNYMKKSNWIPNQVVPVLPIDTVNIPTQLEIQRWRLMYQRKRERERAATEFKNMKGECEHMTTPASKIGNHGGRQAGDKVGNHGGKQAGDKVGNHGRRQAGDKVRNHGRRQAGDRVRNHEERTRRQSEH